MFEAGFANGLVLLCCSVASDWPADLFLRLGAGGLVSCALDADSQAYWPSRSLVPITNGPSREPHLARPRLSA
jgi:hypothetical protein